MQPDLVSRHPDPGSRWSLGNPGNQAILAERLTQTQRLLAASGRLPLTGRRVLEVGCGSGAELARMLEFGALAKDLIGIDKADERLALARQTYPDLDFRSGDASALDFGDAEFDLVLAVTLFTSILETNIAAAAAREVVRVLRRGGAVLWYDFRYDNPYNPNVRGVGASRIRSLFPSLDVTLKSVTVLPPLTRRLGPLTRGAYPLLAALPPLRTHYVGLMVKP